MSCTDTMKVRGPAAPWHATGRPLAVWSGPVRLPPEAAGFLIHGGAWDIPDDELEGHVQGLGEAARAARTVVEDGGTAFEIAVEAVASMESNGAFDAGRGAVLTNQATVELDAGVMDGATHRYGSVIAVSRCPQPVRVAARLADLSTGQVRTFFGVAAERFAEEQGLPLVDPEALVCDRERRRYAWIASRTEFHTSDVFTEAGRGPAPAGTVGCVARDRSGQVAAATSTGGTPFRPVGRVGDTPFPGAGFYAMPHAAASATGWGEAISTILLTARAVMAARTESPEDACSGALRQMAAAVLTPDGGPATGGLILLGADGRGAWAFTSPRMARAAWHVGLEDPLTAV